MLKTFSASSKAYWCCLLCEEETPLPLGYTIHTIKGEIWGKF